MSWREKKRTGYGKWQRRANNFFAQLENIGVEPKRVVAGELCELHFEANWGGDGWWAYFEYTPYRSPWYWIMDNNDIRSAKREAFKEFVVRKSSECRA